MKKPRIALAQIRYYDLNKTHNLEKIKQYIKKAKQENADIVCFPEYALHKTQILKVEHKAIKEIQEECKKNSIWCIINHEFNLKGKNYNASLLIDRQGRIKGDYKKRYLYGDDNMCLGKKSTVFQTDFAKIGIAICWDLAFQKPFAEMKRNGAQIVFCPAQWRYESKAHDKDHVQREIELLRSLIMSRAFENLLFVAVCNPVIEAKDMVSYSGISAPHKILKEILYEEGLIVADIELGEINKLEKLYRTNPDIRVK